MALDPATAGLSVADDLLKAGLQFQSEKNTAAEIQAKESRELQALKDKINALIAANTPEALDEIRKLVAS